VIQISEITKPDIGLIEQEVVFVQQKASAMEEHQLISKINRLLMELGFMAEFKTNAELNEVDKHGTEN
jgi:hypothetical protein